MVGPSIGPYRILQRLGAGGMGEVYLAEDPRLKRQVAIKTVAEKRLGEPDARRRLLREARAAANLSHPNIAAIYDILESDGRAHIVMEYVRGETLAAVVARGPLGPARALEIGVQLADALEAAHALGIVHRDLKPHNVVLTPDAKAKVLDFGLAKRQLTDESEFSSSAEITPSGYHVIGTPQYMSPEQLKGRPVDARSDLYSFGVVLFEMLTGRRPYEGRDPQILLTAILSEPPPSARALNPAVPADLDAIARRAMAREPDARYASAAALRSDLARAATGQSGISTFSAAALLRSGLLTRPVPRWLALALLLVAGVRWLPQLTELTQTSTAPGSVVPRLVILPFTNAAGPSNEYVTRRLEESIAQRFARVASLEAVSVDESALSQDEKTNPAAIVREAGAASALTGTVAHSGDQVVMECRLLAAGGDRIQWTKTYRIGRAELLEVERQLVLDVAQNMNARLSSLDVGRLVQIPTKSSEAYDLYAKGRLIAERREESGLRRALAYFDEAVVVDPGFADAFAASANVYNLLYYYGFASAADVLPRARAAAIRALELDPDNVEAHVTIANLRANDWDWRAAEASYRKAVELGPGDPAAFHPYSICLAITRRLEEALAAIERAVALDPFSNPIRATRGWLHYLRHELEPARRDLENVVTRDPAFLQAKIELAKVYGQLGQFARARALLEPAGPKEQSEAAAVLAYLAARAGDPTLPRKTLKLLLQHSQDVPPGRIAIVAGAIGDIDLAISYLEKAYQRRDVTITFVLVEPLFDPLRKDPRFERLASLVAAGTGSRQVDLTPIHRLSSLATNAQR